MIDYNFLFESHVCPFCGSKTLAYARQINKDIFKLLKVKKEIANSIIDMEKEFEKELRKAFDGMINDAFLLLENELGNSVMLEMENKSIKFSLNYAWIYVKLWQEKSWIALKFGKTKDFEKREKQYDDHDYVLNLCVPVPDFALNDYEDFLRGHIVDILIPFVLEYKKLRLKEVLGGDFESVKLKSGIAPERKEYWRIYIHEDSAEYVFLLANLQTFFYALTKPGWPITYDEWITLKKRMDKDKRRELQTGHQLDLFSDMGNEQ